MLDLIPLYSNIAPLDPANAFELPSSVDHNDLDHPTFDFISTLQILTDTQSTTLSARFRREADAYYLEAKRSMVSSISQIPMWIYAVLVVLGWNEFIVVLKNPVYFLMLLVVGGGSYLVFQLNMVSPSFLGSWRVLREGGRAVLLLLLLRESSRRLFDPFKNKFRVRRRSSSLLLLLLLFLLLLLLLLLLLPPLPLSLSLQVLTNSCVDYFAEQAAANRRLETPVAASSASTRVAGGREEEFELRERRKDD